MSTIAESVVELPTGTWALDQVHSHVGFAVEYVVGAFRGSFRPFDASLEVDESGDARLVGSARATDVKIDEPNLLGHLLSPDFFDADQTPEIRFVSSSFRGSDDTIAVRGDLTIKSRTEPVELTGTVTGPVARTVGDVEVEQLGLRLATTVDRTRFGLEWNLPLPNGKKSLADDVRLEAELFFVKR